MSAKERQERLSVFVGSAEKDNEPDYELLAKHIEQWIQNPENLPEIVLLKEQQEEARKNNLKSTGASKSLDGRMIGAIPPSLFNILIILSPNFLGAHELTPDAKKKRVHKFFKRFPMFLTCEKL